MLCGDLPEFPQEVYEELMGTIDLLPSLAAITQKSLPSQRKIDGVDASHLILGTEKPQEKNSCITHPKESWRESVLGTETASQET